MSQNLCKHGVHYADNCQKCMPIYTEEELQEEIKEAKKAIPADLIHEYIMKASPEDIREMMLAAGLDPKEEADKVRQIIKKHLNEDPLKNALHHFLSFGRPREGSDRYHKAWDKLKEVFEGME